MTAAVIGANIGAGVMLLFAPPVMLVLVAFAGMTAWHEGELPWIGRVGTGIVLAAEEVGR